MEANDWDLYRQLQVSIKHPSKIYSHVIRRQVNYIIDRQTQDADLKKKNIDL